LERDKINPDVTKHVGEGDSSIPATVGLAHQRGQTRFLTISEKAWLMKQFQHIWKKRGNITKEILKVSK
jgi:hypothetical protein